MQFDYRGIPIKPVPKVTDETMKQRGGWSQVIYHPPPKCKR